MKYKSGVTTGRGGPEVLQIGDRQHRPARTRVVVNKEKQ